MTEGLTAAESRQSPTSDRHTPSDWCREKLHDLGGQGDRSEEVAVGLTVSNRMTRWVGISTPNVPSVFKHPL